MNFSPRPKSKRVVAVCFLGGLLAFLFYQYNSQLWINVVKLYHISHDPHQLKEVLISFGPYSPLVYILIQISQVILAPIPGGPIEFLGGYLFGVKAE